jgi:hypothetical protein
VRANLALCTLMDNIDASNIDKDEYEDEDE